MTAPSGREVIDQILANFRSDTHTSFPARVVAYNAEAQTVDLSPALQREVASDDPSVPWEFERLPDLLDVQLMWPRGGGHVITFPLKPGDWVLVLCAEQSTLLWRSRATVHTHPGLTDPHGLNGCVAIPGWFPDRQKLGNVSATDLVIGDLSSDATLRIKPDGSVVIGGEMGAVPVALAPGVQAAMKALAGAMQLAGAVQPATPVTAAVAAVATVIDAWSKDVNVAATKVRAR